MYFKSQRAGNACAWFMLFLMLDPWFPPVKVTKKAPQPLKCTRLSCAEGCSSWLGLLGSLSVSWMMGYWYTVTDWCITSRLQFLSGKGPTRGAVVLMRVLCCVVAASYVVRLPVAAGLGMVCRTCDMRMTEFPLVRNIDCQCLLQQTPSLQQGPHLLCLVSQGRGRTGRWSHQKLEEEHMQQAPRTSEDCGTGSVILHIWWCLLNWTQQQGLNPRGFRSDTVTPFEPIAQL